MKLYAAKSKEEQVSILALIETVGSAVAALWLAIHWGTFAPFAISVVFAPLLLLRTRDSTAHGVRLARKYTQWVKYNRGATFSKSLVEPFGFFLCPLVIRVIATIRSVFGDPLGCAALVPSNWWNFIARIDTTVAPQVVPGFRSPFRLHSTVGADMWDISNYIDGILPGVPHGESTTPTVSDRFAFLALGVLVCLPAWLYRWSLKSTFWIYLPLLWVVQPIRYNRKDVWARIEFIRNNRGILYLSAGVLVLGLIKIRIWQMKSAFSAWWNDTTLGQFFQVYVAPDSMPIWQYASMANCILAFAMFFTARSALQSQKESAPWPDAPLDSGFRFATACRRILTTYTTVVLVMITLKQGFPPLGEFLPL